MTRKDNGSNSALFLSCQMRLLDGTLFIIKHTPLSDGNHPISSPICPMGAADTLGHNLFKPVKQISQQALRAYCSNIYTICKGLLQECLSFCCFKSSRNNLWCSESSNLYRKLPWGYCFWNVSTFATKCSIRTSKWWRII